MNTLQPALLELETLTATVAPKVSREATIQERFEAFDRENPHVYRALRTLALGMVRAGVRHYGIKGLVERVRWEFTMQTKDGDGSFKICNTYTSRYARLLVKNEPELEDFFELRELTSE